MTDETPSPQEGYKIAFTDEDKALLVRIIQIAFPHRSLPSGPYERTAETMMDEANGSAWYSMVLKKNLRTLNDIEGRSFVDLDFDSATRVLHRLQNTEFFGFVRRTAMLALYDHEDVWNYLGYEGPSFNKGGYINRGFDDLDWLPEPRVALYDGPEEWQDVLDEFPSQRTPPPHFAERDTVTQPGRTETKSPEAKK